MRLGLDFDNTLLCYDDLFHKISVENSYIPAFFPKSKNAVRDYLHKNDMEDEWTRMQGEVYGSRINEAFPFEGMLDTLKLLKKDGIKMYLVSHKTRTPYKGPSYDLHKAARDWLIKNGFFDEDNGLGWRSDQVFLETKKEDKIKRIISLGCTHYIDDLPEILDGLPNSIHKIWFRPETLETSPTKWMVLKKWKDLPELLKNS